MRAAIERVMVGAVLALVSACSDEPRPVELPPEPSGCEQLSPGCYRGYVIAPSDPRPWNLTELDVVDIDGDGALDIVHFYEYLTVVPGRKDGTFGSRELYLVGSHHGAAVGDLDGDGHPDVVGGNLTVTYGGPDSTLPAPVGMPEFVSPRRLARARWLGDERLAVAVCDRVGELALLEDLGGSFAERFRVAIGDPVDVAAIELGASPGDAVGMVVADLQGTIWLLSPGQSGALSPDSRRSIATGERPRRLATGDLDGDGRDELAVVFEGEPWARIYGQLEVAVPAELELLAEIPLATGSRDLELVDLDADGDLDLLTLASDGFELELHRGLGGAQFEAPERYLMGVGPQLLELADVDGDGFLDVVVLTEVGELALRRGDGQAGLGDLQLGTAPDPDYPTYIASLVAADLLPSEGTELAIGLDVSRWVEQVSSYVQIIDWVDGELRLAHQVWLAHWIADLVADDLDRDGERDDLLGLARDLGTLVSFYSLGLDPSGELAGFSYSQTLLDTFTGQGVGLLDLDGDGDLDVVAGGSEPVVIENLGGRQLAVRDPGTREPCYDFARVGDYDEDGLDDVLVLGRCNDPAVSVHLGDGDGGLTPGPIAPLPELSIALERTDVGDVDGDGHLDLVTAPWDRATLELLLGRGDGSFARVSAALDYEPDLLALADGDLDGRDELWLSVAGELFVRVVQVVDRRELLGVLELPLPGEPIGMLVADFNADDYPDLVAYRSDDEENWVQGWISAP